MDQHLLNMVDWLRTADAVAPTELSERLGVSTRTVRSYVQRVNRELAGAAEIKHERGKGYCLIVHDAAALDRALATSAQSRQSMLPETHEERIAYLLEDLLSRADWVTLDDLSQVLYTSRRTITEDLRGVERELGRFGLVLERRPRYGMRVEGSELSRRLCMAHHAAERVSAAGGVIDSRMLETVSACINRVVADESFSINGIAFQNLIVHIAVAIVRMAEGAYVPMELAQLESVRGTAAFACAQHIAHAIEEAFSIELPDEEVAYIALHLSGRQLLQDDDIDQGLVISDEVWGVVNDMLEVVWKNFHFDFRADLELRMNLARHIVPLAVRLRYHMRLDNPLLADITTRFPLAWWMAKEAASVLATHYHHMPSDDEIGYIALAFAFALERRHEEAPKKRILVVCALGAGSAKLLEHQYRQEFGAYLEDVETCDIGHVDDVDFSKIDYVFTTVPIPHSLPVPVRRVQFFLDGPEIGDVRRILAYSDAPDGTSVEDFFDERLFFPHRGDLDREATISLLCDTLRAVAGAPDTLEGLIWQREALAPTAFGGLVAMPHPLEPVTERTHVAVALLDEPIDWAGQPVRIVFLVSISTNKGRDLDGLYTALVRFMNEGRLAARLLEDQTFSTLKALLGKED